MVEPNFCSKCEILYPGSGDKCPNCTQKSIIAEDAGLKADINEFMPIVKDIWVLDLERRVVDRWVSRVKSKTDYTFEFDIKEEIERWVKLNIREPVDIEKIDVLNDLVESGAERVSFKRKDRKKVSLITLTIRGERVVGFRPS